MGLYTLRLTDCSRRFLSKNLYPAITAKNLAKSPIHRKTKFEAQIALRLQSKLNIMLNTTIHVDGPTSKMNVTLTGSFTHTNAAKFKNRFVELLQSFKPEGVNVKFDRVTEIDLIGVNGLLTIRNASRSKGIDFGIEFKECNSEVSSVFDMVQFDRMVA